MYSTCPIVLDIYENEIKLSNNQQTKKNNKEKSKMQKKKQINKKHQIYMIVKTLTCTVQIYLIVNKDKRNFAWSNNVSTIPLL